ncbi:MAG: hypothetical protein K0U86_11310 [Planctomycetes bacterium]|nr:hypothetical protein [Planctomycetota bacterium]MCH9725470.1 hypothetical protein [Planctomycetota bacterium]MCH9776567.1 hypothetical protein [Planctomycetota bacterium]MCH9792499.1 hypothetical protein [Planctomycetota bacterium]MDF1746302.1 hypothetical protein [Gimesia sp.]
MRTMQLFQKNLILTLILTVFVTGILPEADAGIEAVKGKKYKLTKRHGPWMIMVAGLSDIPDSRRSKGLSAQEAADELVFELRKRGIPAYTFQQESVIQRFNTLDRLGREERRSYAAQRAGISVIAGNYSDSNDDVAQKTLKYIKKFQPKVLTENGVYKKTPGQPGPLSGAFLAINPRLSPQEVANRKQDPLIAKLNSGIEYSLLKNKGKYSLVVASFYGNSVTKTATSRFQNASKTLKVGKSLDLAAENAWRLAKALRNAKSYGFPAGAARDIDAYVLHEKYRSIVTVGSFDSPDDPRLTAYAKLFGSKMKPHPETNVESMTAEYFVIPGKTPQSPPIASWVFDPKPTLMRVPKAR